MSDFDFLTTEWKDIYAAASKAESGQTADPVTASRHPSRHFEANLVDCKVALPSFS